MKRAAGKEKQELPRVGAEDIDQLIAAGATVIDVRDPGDYAASHIPGAANLSIAALAESAAASIPDKDAVVVCYCNGGTRGPRAAAELQRLGYTNACPLAGGFRGYVSYKHA